MGASPGSGGPGQDNINSIYGVLTACLIQALTGILTSPNPTPPPKAIFVSILRMRKLRLREAMLP